MLITIIAAVARNRAIGYQNKLLYWLPNDLKRFKALTTGHTVIMGRRTFESLPKGALPNRRNIVLSRTQTHFEGCDSSFLLMTTGTRYHARNMAPTSVMPIATPSSTM